MVTGVNGFVGYHLAENLHSNGWGVIGVGHDPGPAPRIKQIVTEYINCDLTDYAAVSSLPLGSVRAVINLAGLAAVGKSFDEPDLYMKVNVGVLATLVQRTKELGRKDLRIVAISSGAVYASGQAMPLNEESITDPSSSPYAASKLAMEKKAKTFRAEGFDCIIARPFNHVGPGQIEGFLLPDLYAKVKAAEGSEIHVGNLETQRDYTDVRDVARAYTALASQDTVSHDVYNVCSGKATSGRQLLELLKREMDFPDLDIVIDEKLFRPSDSPILYGDNSRLRKETDWQPALSLEQTVHDFTKAAV